MRPGEGLQEQVPPPERLGQDKRVRPVELPAPEWVAWATGRAGSRKVNPPIPSPGNNLGSATVPRTGERWALVNRFLSMHCPPRCSPLYAAGQGEQHRVPLLNR